MKVLKFSKFNTFSKHLIFHKKFCHSKINSLSYNNFSKTLDMIMIKCYEDIITINDNGEKQFGNLNIYSS